MTPTQQPVARKLRGERWQLFCRKCYRAFEDENVWRAAALCEEHEKTCTKGKA